MVLIQFTDKEREKRGKGEQSPLWSGCFYNGATDSEELEREREREVRRGRRRASR